MVIDYIKHKKHENLSINRILWNKSPLSNEIYYI